ncbi:hypothetical protein GCM10009111_33120 [Colwellia asteriadis]|uniref:Lipoprotein n=1 Tax=Colwellia asteriadis TaxID=517723 RepID=A0ABN1LAX7_9GAMM
MKTYMQKGLAYLTTLVCLIGCNPMYGNVEQQISLPASYAANYLTEEQLKYRLSRGFSNKLSDPKIDKLYFRLEERGFSQAKLQQWGDRNWLSLPHSVDTLIYAIKQNKTDEALTIASSVKLSELSEYHKLQIFLLALIKSNDEVKSHIVSQLNIGQQAFQLSRFDSRDHYQVLTKLLDAFYQSDASTASNIEQVKRAFQRYQEYIHPSYISHFISTENAREATLGQQIQWGTFAPPSLADFDKNNAEAMNQAVLEMVMYIPYASEEIAKLKLSLLSSSAKQRLFHWALSVDHQSLIKQLITQHDLRISNANINLLSFFNNTAAPLSWYQGFASQAITLAANQLLKKQCEALVLSNNQQLLLYADFNHVDKSALSCVISYSSSRSILQKALHAASNLTSNELEQFYIEFIKQHFTVLRSLIADQQLTINKEVMLGVLKSEEMSMYLFEHYQVWLKLGLDEKELAHIIQAELNTQQGERYFLQKGEHLMPSLIQNTWFKDLLCSMILSINYVTSADHIVLFFNQNDITCSVESLKKVLENKELFRKLYHLEPLLADDGKLHLLFALFDAKRTGLLSDFLEEYGSQFLFMENEQGELLYDKLMQAIQNNTSLMYGFKPFLKKHFIYESTINPNKRLLAASRQRTPNASLNVAILKQVLNSYPYNRAELFNVFQQALKTSDINYRHALFEAYSLHSQFTDYPNTWPLFKKLFTPKYYDKSIELIEYYAQLGYSLDKLKNLPNNTLFTCKELAQYLKFGLPVNIKTASNKSLTELVHPKAPSCVNKLFNQFSKVNVAGNLQQVANTQQAPTFITSTGEQ